MRASDSINIEVQKENLTTKIYSTDKDIDIDMNSIDLQDQLDHNTIATYKLSKSVKYFSLTNIFFNLLFIFFSPYYVFFIICSIFGYYASFKFNLKYIYIYFTYQIINALLWISICIYDDILQFSEDNIIYTSLNIICCIMMTLLNIYIIRFTYRLICRLRNCTLDDIVTLKNIRTLKLKMLFW